MAGEAVTLTTILAILLFLYLHNLVYIECKKNENAHLVPPVPRRSEGMCESAPEHGREKVPILVGYTVGLSLPASGPGLLSTGKTNGPTQPSAVCASGCEILPKTS